MANSPTRDAGIPADPAACPAPRPDWTVDQHWERYSDDEHAVWRHLYERQSRLLPGRACNDYLAGLRTSQLDYLEEPDVFHDVFGHVPMLMNPVMADFVQAYGIGGLRASGLGVLAELARVYWYTVEFGLVSQPDGLRIYGSGILLSSAETRLALEDSSPHRVRFALPRVMRTRYRIDDFQEV